MKSKYLLILISLQICFAKAQTVDFYGKKIDASSICNSLGFTNSTNAKNYLDKVCDAAGIHNNFIMVPCNSIQNCLAIQKNGDAYILYDNTFLNKLKNTSYGFTEKKISSELETKNSVDDWEVLTILAHELGHHENQHFSNAVRNSGVSLKDLELQADEYAGEVMFKLGASLEDGEKVFNSSIVPVGGTLDHPARADRLKAFENGYKKESGKYGNKNHPSNNSNNYATLILGSWAEEKGAIMTFEDNGTFKVSENGKIHTAFWELINDQLNLKDNETRRPVSLTIVGLNEYSISLKDPKNNNITTLKRTSIDASSGTNNYFKKNWSKYIYIDKFNYSSRRIGGISDVNVPIVNNSDYLIDLIRVKVEYVKDGTFASGDIYKTEYINFTNVQPHGKLTIHAPDSDRGTTVRTAITVIQAKAINLLIR